MVTQERAREIWAYRSYSGVFLVTPEEDRFIREHTKTMGEDAIWADARFSRSPTAALRTLAWRGLATPWSRPATTSSAIRPSRFRRTRKSNLPRR
jgi:hypothetical protein